MMYKLKHNELEVEVMISLGAREWELSRFSNVPSPMSGENAYTRVENQTRNFAGSETTIHLSPQRNVGNP